MFTPQRKFGENGDESASAKQRRFGGFFSRRKGEDNGEAVVSQPQSTLVTDNGGNAMMERNGSNEARDWLRLRESGSLDQTSMEKDREAHAQKIANLESELFEYQYNLGLLLIEKKEWTGKYEELRQALSEAEEMLKRDQAAHVIAISEVEKREENLKKSLGIEKQCVADLEKALHALRAEYAEIKFMSDKKLADAHELLAGIEGKSLEVEAKLHSADAKLAEGNRKSSELDRKLQDLEARESVLRRERLSFNSERDVHQTSLSQQREDLRSWEAMLQESQERHLEEQRRLNQREERLNQNDRVLKQEQIKLEETEKRLEMLNLSLREKEADINLRLKTLSTKEEEFRVTKNNVEGKERDLSALEERLIQREKTEIQKLLDEHNTSLELKRQEFEIELGQKRKSLENEFKIKLRELEERESNVNCKEGKVAEREGILEKNLEKLKNKELDIELKIRALEDKEKCFKLVEENVESEKKQANIEKNSLQSLKDEIEKTRAVMEVEKQSILKEQENLKVTEDEKREFDLLQSTLKKEIEACRFQKEFHAQGLEDLKQERIKFEKEWEMLDDRKAEIVEEHRNVKEDTERFLQWKFDEEERLKAEKLVMDGDIQREREILRLEKEAFVASMQHERSLMLEEYQRKHVDKLREFDLRHHELERDVHNRREEMENLLREKQRAFEEEREKELKNINSLREQVEQEIREMKLDKIKIDREKDTIAMSKKFPEGVSLKDIHNDINELQVLSDNLKEQREIFLIERDRFLSYVDQCKKCMNCGYVINEFVFSSPQNIDGSSKLTVLGKLQSERSPLSVGGMSWLRKCTSKIFNFSPLKKIDDDLHAPSILSSLDMPALLETSEKLEKHVEPSHEIVNNEPVDIPRIQSDVNLSEPSFSINIQKDEENIPLESFPAGSGPKKGQKLEKRLRPKVTRRTRTVKSVVEEAKIFLGESSEQNKVTDGEGESSIHVKTQDESPRLARRVRRKRQYDPTYRGTEKEDDDSETQSGSITIGGQRKRRQIVTPRVKTPGEKRYYFRRSTVAGTAAVDPSSSNQIKAGKVLPQFENLSENEMRENVVEMKHTQLDPDPSVDPMENVSSETNKSIHPTGAVGSIVEVREELSSHKFFMLETGELFAETDGPVDKFFDKIELIDQHDPDGDAAVKVANGVMMMNVTSDEKTYDSESDEEDAQNEEERENREISIGKKVWNFLTT